MHDLRVLEYLNEQAHLRAIARAEENALAKVVPEAPPAAPASPVFPLAYLSRRLTFGPPSLVYLLDIIENSELIIAFFELVSEYLPDREDEIRMAAVEERITMFARYFSATYFPLSDSVTDLGEEYELGDFLSYIPVDLMGFTSYDYHEFTDFRTGYILILSLIESPYVEWGAEEEGTAGGRIPIIAHVSDLLGRDIAELIPDDGLTPEKLHDLTDGTPFDGVGAFADWLHQNTGCWQLDANHEEYEGESWAPNIVSELTSQYPQVMEIWDKIGKASDYLEESPKKRFLELLSIILSKNAKGFIVPDEQIPLPLI
ncbi:hypothetical protein ES707_19874 [subsurface metagenome]